MLWEAVTDKPIKIKSLLETLLHNLDTVCFRISDQGMFLHDLQNNTLITVTLPASSFKQYKYISEKPQVYATLTQIIMPDLKALKNKSCVTLSLRAGPSDNEPAVICISVQGGTVSNVLSVVVDQTPSVTLIKHPTCESQPLKFKQSDFNTMCKTFKQGPVMIGISDGRLVMSGGVENIKIKELAFGEQQSNLGNPPCYFKMTAEKLNKLTKLGTFANENLVISAGINSLSVESEGDLGIIFVTLFCQP